MGRLLVVAVSLLVSSFAVPAATAEDPPPPVVTGYALGSASDALIEANAPGLDTVTVAGVGLGRAGGAVADPTDDMLRVLTTAHDQGLRGELLLSNFSDALGDFDPRAAERLLGSNRKQRRVAKAVRGLVRDGGWDGVNVDLERLEGIHPHDLVGFLERLRSLLPTRVSLSIDVPARTSARGYRRAGFDLVNVAATVDLVQLMAYDQHGPAWSGPGPVGALDWQRECLDAALEQVPADRLDLGVAGYGYLWHRDGSGFTVSDSGARRRVDESGTEAHWRPHVGEWMARLGDGDRMWWSDARSYAARVDLAQEYGLHGLAVWRLGSADTLPAPSLVRSDRPPGAGR
ncbi:glycosyl hydrolase family 18 protein [Nocardioides acrostichi]|uniref:Hydrolase n=1 Tax=Nocardioides acrostichi TaxID=2784339 RepID=A0A930UUC7_9ACTN|nr:glycosyl hydrolase family 18 protein [Nocardioides acrostichi]MBF4161008.1 hydrolase [Nocardioides acrostichi]